MAKRKVTSSRTLFGKGVEREIKAIGNIVAPNQSKGLTQKQKERIFKEEIRRVQPRQQVFQKRQRPNNFFEHKSEQEIYGDTGLTLFDSNKSKRNQNYTGELFGLG